MSDASRPSYSPSDSTVAGLLRFLAEGHSLSEDQAATIAGAFVRGEATPVQMAALLTALRVRGETVDEILGFVRVMRTASIPIPVSADEIIDTCGAGGDGLGTFNISTVAAFVAAGAGCKVAKHGARASSSRSGSADVLEALGVNIQLPPEESAQLLSDAGIAFLFAPQYHPGARHAVAVRRELGFRTIFNIIGPILHPANAKRQVIGVYEARLTEVVAGALQRLGSIHALVVHGDDGLDEITLTGPTRVAELRNGEIRDRRVTPEQFGLSRILGHEALRGGTPVENAAIAKAILSGERSPRRDIVLLNAGAAIYVAGKAATIEEGVRTATASIDSGAALRALEKLVNLGNAGQ